jgi:hypothetical protein
VSAEEGEAVLSIVAASARVPTNAATTLVVRNPVLFILCTPVQIRAVGRINKPSELQVNTESIHITSSQRKFTYFAKEIVATFR